MGRVLDHVRSMHRLNLNQFADALKREARQVARWIDGKERPQIDAVFAVVEFRNSLVIAFAELAGVEVETVVRIRRRA